MLMDQNTIKFYQDYTVFLFPPLQRGSHVQPYLSIAGTLGTLAYRETVSARGKIRDLLEHAGGIF